VAFFREKGGCLRVINLPRRPLNLLDCDCFRHFECQGGSIDVWTMCWQCSRYRYRYGYRLSRVAMTFDFKGSPLSQVCRGYIVAGRKAERRPRWRTTASIDTVHVNAIPSQPYNRLLRHLLGG
jgi:hypothetical protein